MKNILIELADKIIFLQAKDEADQIAASEKELLATLEFCFDILQLTQEAEKYRDEFPKTESELLEFVFLLITSNQPLDLRKLVQIMIKKKGISVRQLAKNVKLRENTILDYINGKTEMQAKNLDKIINFCK